MVNYERRRSVYVGPTFQRCNREQHRSFLWFWLFVKSPHRFYRLPTTYSTYGGEKETCWYCAPHEQLFVEIGISLWQSGCCSIAVWTHSDPQLPTPALPRSHFVTLLMTAVISAVRNVRESTLRLSEECGLDLSSFTFPYASPASAVKELSSCQWKYER